MSDYIDLHALAKVLAVTLLASVLVPVAFSAAIVGLGRREEASELGRTSAVGTLLVVLGIFVCVVAIALGIWAILQK